MIRWSAPPRRHGWSRRPWRDVVRTWLYVLAELVVLLWGIFGIPALIYVIAIAGNVSVR